MDIYRYLEKHSPAQAWVTGGSVPIFPASRYLSDDRKGIMTPDEVLQRTTDFSADDFKLVNRIVSGYGEIQFTDNMVDDDGVARLISGTWTQSSENVMVLCFSTVLSRRLANRMDKLACVVIRDQARLFEALNKQLGVAGERYLVDYVGSPNRHHFTKDVKDSWQAEARMIWRTATPEMTWVNLPPGIGQLVDLGAIAEAPFARRSYQMSSGPSTSSLC